MNPITSSSSTKNDSCLATQYTLYIVHIYIHWRADRVQIDPKYIPYYLETLLPKTDNFTEPGSNLKYFIMLIVRLFSQDRNYWLVIATIATFKRFSYSPLPLNEWLESNHWYQWFWSPSTIWTRWFFNGFQW